MPLTAKASLDFRPIPQLMAYKRRNAAPSLNWLSAYFKEVRPKVLYPFFRRQICLPEFPKGLVIRLAENQKDLESSYRLLHDVHTELGWMKADPSGLKVSVYNLLPHTSTIVALINDKVVGTVSLVRDNELGLPASEIFDTDFFRKPASQIAEVMNLAVSREHRGLGEVLFPLLKYVYHYAVDYLKVDIFQIACAPKHQDFYRSLFYFEPIEEKLVSDPFVDGASMVGLYLDLKEGKTLMKRVFDSRPTARSLSKYFFDLRFEGHHFPQRNIHQVLDPAMTPALADYFFAQKTKLLEHLSDRELHVLREIYRGTPMESILREPRSQPPFVQKRGTQRYLVSCPAIMESDEGDQVVTLLDVSLTGFRLATKYPLRLNQDYGFRIQISDKRTVPLRARPVWHRRRREWGFQILEVPQAWQSFLDLLSAPIKKAA